MENGLQISVIDIVIGHQPWLGEKTHYVKSKQNTITRKMLVADNSAHLPIYFKTPCFINITFKMSPKSSLNSKSKHFSQLFLALDSQARHWM